jgi:flagellar biosynthesis/type III secretory pathway M-ring protein FliF/YscJ
MKKAIVGLLAVGAAIALRPVVRRMGQKMREHCKQMAAQFGARGEADHTMRECCEQMAA